MRPIPILFFIYRFLEQTNAWNENEYIDFICSSLASICCFVHFDFQFLYGFYYTLDKEAKSTRKEESIS